MLALFQKIYVTFITEILEHGRIEQVGTFAWM